jgi:hypothetical protein
MGSQRTDRQATQRPEEVISPLTLHACAVAIGENGVLIRGASGAGKSTLALALVEAQILAGGFARLVGDDRILAHAAGGRVVMSPHRAIEGLVEWRGMGLLEQAFEPSAVLSLVVDLESGPPTLLPRLPEPETLETSLCGVKGLARLRLPAWQTALSVAAIMVFLHKMPLK